MSKMLKCTCDEEDVYVGLSLEYFISKTVNQVLEVCSGLYKDYKLAFPGPIRVENVVNCASVSY
jgi:hypothetical protein